MKTLEQEGWVLKPDITKSHSELLNTDLSHVGAKIIPPDFASVTSLNGPKILQFKRVKDVSHSKISHENGSNKSMFRITLSDGNSTCSAMNLQPIPGLSGKVYPGTKLRIIGGGAQVLGGFLLLTPGNCEILGGRVEKLVENIEKNENISKKKSNDGGPPKFVPFGSSAKNGPAKLELVHEKPNKRDIENENRAGSSYTDHHSGNSRNDKKNFDRDQKSSHQKDRGGKSSGKRGQSTRNSDDHRGQNYHTDTKSSNDRGKNKNRGNQKQDFRGAGGSRGNYNNDNRHNNNRDRGEDDFNSSERSRGRGRGSRGKDRSRRDDYSPPERTQSHGFSLGDMVQDFPALGSGSPSGNTSTNLGKEDVFRGSDRSNSRETKDWGGSSSRGGDDSSGRSRGRGRGSRGKDRSRRDDYSPPERTHPQGFSLGDMVQNFPALGTDSPSENASSNWGREDAYSGSDRSNSRGYEDRGGSGGRSRGRGRGSRGRGNSRSRRDDYPSRQNKPAEYKADLEADFPTLGGGTTNNKNSASNSYQSKPVKSNPGALVDDEGFEIHDHLLYDDNGPPRQLHDPSLHHKQGYDSYRPGSEQIVNSIRDMTVSDSVPHHSGRQRDNRGKGGDFRGSKNQDNRRRDTEKGSNQSYRRGADDADQGRRDYERSNNARYDQRYDDRYEQRHNDRYDQRYDDRYEQRFDDRRDDRRDDRYNPGRNVKSSDRSNLSGNRGRSSGHYRRY